MESAGSPCEKIVSDRRYCTTLSARSEAARKAFASNDRLRGVGKSRGTLSHGTTAVGRACAQRDTGRSHRSSTVEGMNLTRLRAPSMRQFRLTRDARTWPMAALAAAIFVLTSPATAIGQVADGYTNARHLGGSTSFHQPHLTTVATLKKMAATKNMAADIRTVLRDAGIPETADAVVAMLSGGTPSVRGLYCGDSAPEDGVLVDCEFQPGGTLEWMAYRPNLKRHDRTPERILKFRWAGRQPFKAFLFRVTTNGRIYTFVVPKDCGNLSLMSVTEPKRELATA